MLKIQNFTKSYNDQTKAVDDLSLCVEPGDVFGFIGPNGAGKTTTLSAVAGIIGFDSGEIWVDGHNVRKEPLVTKARIAYIPDNPDLYQNLTGAQYLNFLADVFGVSTAARKEKITMLSERFEIQKALADPISSYSHGMRQKTAVIGALLHDPKLMLLDEPFVGLDPKAALTLKELMRDLCEKGSAVFFSSHVLEVVEKLCNKVAIIAQGKLVRCGKTEEIVGDQSLEAVFMEVAE